MSTGVSVRAGRRRAAALAERGGAGLSLDAVRGVYRAEARKLRAQLSTRLLALACLLGPAAFALMLRVQSGLPADTIFGVWVHQSGYAVSLVVLGFAGSWGFPVIAGCLAGDLFASEDRHDTWKMVLCRSVSRQELLAGKLLAVGAFAVGMVALTAASSLGAGVLSAGARPLVGLSGITLPSSQALALVMEAWAVSILPALGFVAFAALFSLLTRNGIAGALSPVLAALVMQLLDLIGNGSWVHAVLLGSAFSDWHGLFVAHTFVQPLVVGSVVSVIWTVAAVTLAWWSLKRRDFAGGVSGAAGWLRPLGMVAAAGAALAVLAAGTGLGPPTITSARLESTLTPAFQRLVVMQQRLLGRPIAPGARLRVIPKCLRRGGASSGPGDDWTCALEVFIPQAGVEPFRETPVTYDMSVQANGCYKADAPPPFIGQQVMRDAHGKDVVNPLYTIYGCFESDG